MPIFMFPPYPSLSLRHQTQKLPYIHARNGHGFAADAAKRNGVKYPFNLYTYYHQTVISITQECFCLVNSWLACWFPITIMSENEHKRAISNTSRKLTWKPKT
ncbi:Uncharacterised protein [Serratia fonticola]|nr:Uncharacterised protein [Serratia fonticola]